MPKHFRLLITVILTALLCAPLCVHAAIASDFTAEDDAGAGKVYYDGLTVAAADTQFVGNGEITGAYVADDGAFLLVLSTADKAGYTDIVEVHNADGSLRTRLDIGANGALGAFLDPEDGALVLYFAKGDVLIKVDDAGGYLDSCAVASSDESNAAEDSLFYYGNDANAWEIAGSNYMLMKNMPGKPAIVRVDRFLVNDADGNMIFRYEQEMDTAAATMSVVFPIVLAACVATLLALFIRSKKRGKQETRRLH
ncbi:MAG: hypothetical protein IIY16_07200 [Oscillospiraceae bacterium]|nr:hypothetical protein [Oscillospiraceae bacterium]